MKISPVLSDHLTELDAENLVMDFYRDWQPSDRKSTTLNELAAYCYERGFRDSEVET